RLDGKVVTVSIDHERRQEIRFAMHEAVRGGVEIQRFAKVDRMRNSRPQERLVGGHIADRQHPDRNLRSIAEQRVADFAMSWSNDLDDLAGGRRNVHDIRAIDPWMAGAHWLLAARGDHDRWLAQGLRLKAHGSTISTLCLPLHCPRCNARLLKPTPRSRMRSGMKSTARPKGSS